jgi:hypothetical protein
MIFYELTFFRSENDPFPSKYIKWLTYDKETNIVLNEKHDNESLAIQIMIQNLQEVEDVLISTTDPSKVAEIGIPKTYVRNEDDLVSILNGKYDKIFVKKIDVENVPNAILNRLKH